MAFGLAWIMVRIWLLYLLNMHDFLMLLRSKLMVTARYGALKCSLSYVFGKQGAIFLLLRIGCLNPPTNQVAPLPGLLHWLLIPAPGLT